MIPILPTDIPIDDDLAATSAPFNIDDGDAREHQPLPQLERASIPDVPTQPLQPVAVQAVQAVGSIVLDAGTVSNAAGTRTVTVGASDTARPGVTGVMLYVTAGAGSCDIMPNNAGDTLNGGFTLPAAGAAPILYPLKRAVLRLTGAVTVAFLVLTSDVPQR